MARRPSRRDRAGLKAAQYRRFQGEGRRPDRAAAAASRARASPAGRAARLPHSRPALRHSLRRRRQRPPRKRANRSQRAPRPASRSCREESRET